MKSWLSVEKIRAIQQFTNSVFIGAVCWIVGYVIGINLDYYLLPEFQILNIPGKEIVGFLFGLLAITLREILLERGKRHKV